MNTSTRRSVELAAGAQLTHNSQHSRTFKLNKTELVLVAAHPLPSGGIAALSPAVWQTARLGELELKSGDVVEYVKSVGKKER